MFAGIAGRMDAVGVESRLQHEALRRTGVDAKPAAFAFLSIDGDFAAR
jgi:hypothetical protein